MTVELAIFDFDGTLADSLPWLWGAFDQVAERYAFRKLDHSKLDDLRHFNLRRLLSQHDIPIWKLPVITRHLQSLVAHGVAATFSDPTELVTKLTRECTMSRAMAAAPTA